MTDDFEAVPTSERVRATLRRMCHRNQQWYTAQDVASECGLKFSVARRGLDLATQSIPPGDARYRKKFRGDGVPQYRYEAVT